MMCSLDFVNKTEVIKKKKEGCNMLNVENMARLGKIFTDSRKIHREIIKLKAEIDLNNSTKTIHEELRKAEGGAEVLSFWTQSSLKIFQDKLHIIYKTGEDNVIENTINK